MAATKRTGADFDKIFSTRGEPEFLHYEVEYLDAQGPHNVEIWRSGNQRLKRATDGRIELYATRLAGDEVRYTILDKARRISTVVDRTNLARLGTVLEWTAQGHGLARPMGDYRLERVAGGAKKRALDRMCQRWSLTVKDRAAPSEICWNNELRIPLTIVDARGNTVWRVTHFSTATIDATTFTVADDGYRRVNMNQDVEPGAD